jgi:hypothetical protein
MVWMDSPGSRGGVNRSGRRRRGRDRTGIAIGLIGFFLVRAAITYDSAQATGLDGALRRIADRSWGVLIVAVVGIGFVAHGVFASRDVHAPSPSGALADLDSPPEGPHGANPPDHITLRITTTPADHLLRPPQV